jgi:hypothetical protein
MCTIDLGNLPFVGPLASPEMVVANPRLGCLSQLHFWDPRRFRAGGIHRNLADWQHLLEDYPCNQIDLLEIVRDGIKVDQLFTHFQGSFKGGPLGLGPPPSVCFANPPVCRRFESFITTTVIGWVSAGVIMVFGSTDPTSLSGFTPHGRAIKTPSLSRRALFKFVD